MIGKHWEKQQKKVDETQKLDYNTGWMIRSQKISILVVSIPLKYV